MIKRIAVFVLLVLLMLSHYVSPVSAEPEYAKWGRLAMRETQKRYQADIVDYLHVGRRQEQPGVVSETFRLRVNKGAAPFTVTVRIWFESGSERVVRIQFSEATDK
jgi:hypothetical protein